MSLASAYRLRGVIQHYEWGGRSFLPEILRVNNAEKQAFAEYWLGTHPKGTARILINGHWEDLAQVISQQPRQWLGEAVVNHFGAELPFLLKILDVDRMLSIQLHPGKEKAQIGFAREEALGIPRLAGHRNYKDQNHKPEFMLALTGFWLLHGFRSPEAIAQTLIDVPGWETLGPILAAGGVRALFTYVMELPQEAVDELLRPLAVWLETDPPTDKSKPHYWAAQAFQDYARNGHYDRGIFSVFWLNLVHLDAGQGIFQGAGIPHAYLEGVNVELMANSDNVLRGGLTPKHIDVPELLENIVTDPIIPKPLFGKFQRKGLAQFTLPVEEFAFTEIKLEKGVEFSFQLAGPSIYWVVEGEVIVQEERFAVGESFFTPHCQEVVLRNELDQPARLVRATAGDFLS